MNKISFVERVKIAMDSAEGGTSKLKGDVLSFEGMTGKKIKHCLNNLCSYDDVKYFEIGLGTGSTHYSSLFENNQIKAFAADMWLKNKVGEHGKENFLSNYQRLLGDLRTKIYHGDCYTIDLKEFFDEDKINVYFFDGFHSTESHYKSLTYFYSILESIFIFVVDDWKNPGVQKGTSNAIKDLDLKILTSYEKYSENSKTGKFGNEEGWWHGLKVFVLEKTK